jgi:hypothetical protein
MGAGLFADPKPKTIWLVCVLFAFCVGSLCQ